MDPFHPAFFEISAARGSGYAGSERSYSAGPRASCICMMRVGFTQVVVTHTYSGLAHNTSAQCKAKAAD